eukprot:g29691.t1
MDVKATAGKDRKPGSAHSQLHHLPQQDPSLRVAQPNDHASSYTGDTLGKLVDSELPIEVGFLGRALHADDHGGYYHAGGEECSSAVDDDLQ